MTELGKLVPFMDDGDRNTALSMYERMFEQTPNEAQLLMKLVSPTRQAVNIARVYDATSRKEELESNSDLVPKFVETIQKIALDALGTPLDSSAPAETPKDSAEIDEVSAKEEPEETVPEENESEEDSPAEETAPSPHDEGEDEDSSSEETPAETIETEAENVPEEETETEEIPVQDPEETDGEEELPGPVSDDMDAKVTAAVAAIAEAVNSASEVDTRDMAQIIAKTRNIYEDDEPAEAPQPNAGTGSTSKNPFKMFFENKVFESKIGEEKKENAIDEFLGNLTVDDEISKAEEAAAAVSDDTAEAAEETAEEDIKAADGSTQSDVQSKDKAPRKVKVGLLILFILIAIPVCSMIIMLLIALAGGLGFAAFTAGDIAIRGISSAFGSYAVFADILLVIGASLIVLALAVLMLWTAIWLIGGAVVGVVKGALNLAEKWCSEEVTA